MNISVDNFDEQSFEYSVKKRAGADAGDSKTRSQRQTFGRKRGKTPQQFNGIHRRRKKKIRW